MLEEFYFKIMFEWFVLCRKLSLCWREFLNNNAFWLKNV